MLEVTPITSKHFFAILESNYYKFTYKLELSIEFLNYLEAEDSLYCRVPDHISYRGQNAVNKRFDWQRKVMEKKLRNISVTTKNPSDPANRGLKN